jgi:hypothetical protein
VNNTNCSRINSAFVEIAGITVVGSVDRKLALSNWLDRPLSKNPTAAAGHDLRRLSDFSLNSVNGGSWTSG